MAECMVCVATTYAICCQYTCHVLPAHMLYVVSTGVTCCVTNTYVVRCRYNAFTLLLSLGTHKVYFPCLVWLNR